MECNVRLGALLRQKFVWLAPRSCQLILNVFPIQPQFIFDDTTLFHVSDDVINKHPHEFRIFVRGKHAVGRLMWLSARVVCLQSLEVSYGDKFCTCVLYSVYKWIYVFRPAWNIGNKLLSSRTFGLVLRNILLVKYIIVGAS